MSGREHGLPGRLEAHQPAGRGQEVAERILRVDAALDRPAFALDLGLRERQRLAGGHADHQLDQVEARDGLGHRMLDLQPRVHLEEVEALVLADHELDRAGALVVDRLGQLHRLLAHGLARLVADEGRRRLLDHLLVAPLDRAFALVEVDHVALRIAQHLDLDVARLLDELLDEDPVVAEAVAGLVAAGGEAVEGVLVVEGHAQALAAAAGRGLDHHRVADLAGNLDRALGRLDGVVPAGNGVDLGFVGQLLGGDLVTHGGNRRVLRADEDDALFFHLAGEGLVLGQEAVARVHRLGAGGLAGRDDAVGLQVAVAAGGAADVHRLVGQLDMAGVLVGVGVDGHREDAHLLGGLDHSASNLTAIGDQDLLEHLWVSRSHRGMLPCLRHGLSSFLSRSITSERQMRLRVSLGRITSSM